MRDRAERFRTLAEKRTNLALRQIRLLGNLANTGNYEYNIEQVKQIAKALEEAIERMENKFNLDTATRGNDNFTLRERD